MSDERVTIDWPEGEDEQTEVFDPGPPPNDEAWKDLADLFPPGSEDAAYQFACDLAEKVVRKERRLESIRSAWAVRMGRLSAALSKLADRLNALAEGEAKACSEVEGQKAFQLARLVAACRTDRFAKAFGMRRGAKSITLPTSRGPFTLSWSDAPKPTWATGEDGRRDDPAIIRAVTDRLTELGLWESVEQFVHTTEKLAVTDLKRALRREGEETVLVVVTDELTEAILDEEARGRLRYEPFAKNPEGLPVSWAVSLPVWAEDVLDGQVVRRRPLLTWEEPNVLESVKFTPAKTKGNGIKAEPQEEATDGDGGA
jgi:hypothetical protein